MNDEYGLIVGGDIQGAHMWRYGTLQAAQKSAEEICLGQNVRVDVVRFVGSYRAVPTWEAWGADGE